MVRNSRVLVLRHALDLECRRRRDRDAPTGMFGGPQLLANLLAGGRRRHLQRLVGLHSQDEVHAALQIEPELQLLRRQPAGHRQAVARARIG